VACLRHEAYGLVHPSAARADVLLALGKQLSERLRLHAEIVCVEKSERERDHKRGRRREAARHGDVSIDERSESLKPADITCEVSVKRLNGGLCVVAPVAQLVWLDIARDCERARLEARIRIMKLNDGIVARRGDEDDFAIDGHRQDGESIVVGVLPDEVYAARRPHKEEIMALRENF